MATQTLAGIAGTEPLHWRGDREDVAAFSVAFAGVNGDDEVPDDEAMDQLAEFLATIRTPPNPNRLATGGLPPAMPNGGFPATGQTLFETLLVTPEVTCRFCHAGATGTSGFVVEGDVIPEAPLSAQDVNVPHLLDMHEKAGLNFASQSNSRGFGFGHDGSFDTIFNMLFQPSFSGFEPGLPGLQQRRDIEAFVLCFATDTHAGVGTQLTLGSAAGAPDGPLAVEDMVALAARGEVGLVAKGVYQGERRGWFLGDGATFQSDRERETIAVATLIGAARPGAELTLTLVPSGSEVRIGVDRDSDGFFDQDEVDACVDPADAGSTPEGSSCCPGDADGDGAVDADDLIAVVLAWSQPGGPADLDGDGTVDVDDLVLVVLHWGPCP